MKALVIHTLLFLYNLIMDIITSIMKIGLILSLPVMFIYFLFNQKKA